MTNLEEYLKDGANYQARAVLMFLQSYANIEESWNDEYRRYDAEIKVGRWENCREQGYIVSLVNSKRVQLNIAFFEHRNSDQISAIKWEQLSLNTITIDTAVFGDVYKDKYDTSHEVSYGQVSEMAYWIKEELSEFWNECI